MEEKEPLASLYLDTIQAYKDAIRCKSPVVVPQHAAVQQAIAQQQVDQQQVDQQQVDVEQERQQALQSIEMKQCSRSHSLFYDAPLLHRNLGGARGWKECFVITPAAQAQLLACPEWGRSGLDEACLPPGFVLKRIVNDGRIRGTSRAAVDWVGDSVVDEDLGWKAYFRPCSTRAPFKQRLQWCADQLKEVDSAQLRRVGEALTVMEGEATDSLFLYEHSGCHWAVVSSGIQSMYTARQGDADALLDCMPNQYGTDVEALLDRCDVSQRLTACLNAYMLYQDAPSAFGARLKGLLELDEGLWAVVGSPLDTRHRLWDLRSYDSSGFRDSSFGDHGSDKRYWHFNSRVDAQDPTIRGRTRQAIILIGSDGQVVQPDLLQTMYRVDLWQQCAHVLEVLTSETMRPFHNVLSRFLQSDRQCAPLFDEHVGAIDDDSKSRCYVLQPERWDLERNVKYFEDFLKQYRAIVQQYASQQRESLPAHYTSDDFINTILNNVLVDSERFEMRSVLFRLLHIMELNAAQETLWTQLDILAGPGLSAGPWIDVSDDDYDLFVEGTFWDPDNRAVPFFLPEAQLVYMEPREFGPRPKFFMHSCWEGVCSFYSQGRNVLEKLLAAIQRACDDDTLPSTSTLRHYFFLWYQRVVVIHGLRSETTRLFRTYMRALNVEQGDALKKLKADILNFVQGVQLECHSLEPWQQAVRDTVRDALAAQQDEKHAQEDSALLRLVDSLCDVLFSLPEPSARQAWAHMSRMSPLLAGCRDWLSLNLNQRVPCMKHALLCTTRTDLGSEPLLLKAATCMRCEAGEEQDASAWLASNPLWCEVMAQFAPCCSDTALLSYQELRRCEEVLREAGSPDERTDASQLACAVEAFFARSEQCVVFLDPAEPSKTTSYNDCIRAVSMGVEEAAQRRALVRFVQAKRSCVGVMAPCAQLMAAIGQLEDAKSSWSVLACMDDAVADGLVHKDVEVLVCVLQYAIDNDMYGANVRLLGQVLQCRRAPKHKKGLLEAIFKRPMAFAQQCQVFEQLTVPAVSDALAIAMLGLHEEMVFTSALRVLKQQPSKGQDPDFFKLVHAMAQVQSPQEDKEDHDTKALWCRLCRVCMALPSTGEGAFCEEKGMLADEMSFVQDIMQAWRDRPAADLRLVSDHVFVSQPTLQDAMRYLQDILAERYEAPRLITRRAPSVQELLRRSQAGDRASSPQLRDRSDPSAQWEVPPVVDDRLYEELRAVATWCMGDPEQHAAYQKQCKTILKVQQRYMDRLAYEDHDPMCRWSDQKLYDAIMEEKHDGAPCEGRLRLLAKLRAVVERTLGFSPHPNQMVAVLLATDPAVNRSLLQVDTGEGKSLITALCAAYACLSARVGGVDLDQVHVGTSNEQLAQDGVDTFQLVWNFLGLKVGVLNHSTSLDASYIDSMDIVYGESSQFSLTHQAHPTYWDVERCIYIGDELDHTYVDDSRHNIITRPTDPLSETHPLLFEWLLAYQARGVHEVSPETLTGLIDAMEEQRRGMADPMEKRRYERAMARLLKRDEAHNRQDNNDCLRGRFKQLLLSAIMARNVFENTPSWRVLTIVDAQNRPRRLAHVVQRNKRVHASLRWWGDVHPLVHMLIEDEERRQGVTHAVPFLSVEAADVCLVDTNVSHIMSYGTVIGMTGSVGRAQLWQEHGFQVWAVPPHTSRKVSVESCCVVREPDDAVTRARYLDYHQQAWERCMLDHDGRPLLCFQAGQHEVEVFFDDMKTLFEAKCSHPPQCMQYFDGTRCVQWTWNAFQRRYEASSDAYITNKEAENELVTQAGLAGTFTVTTEAMSRGTDIKPRYADGILHEEGLAVLIGYLVLNKRVRRQMWGRAGRQGQRGWLGYVIAWSDLMDHSMSSLRDGLERAMRAGAGNGLVTLEALDAVCVSYQDTAFERQRRRVVCNVFQMQLLNINSMLKEHPHWVFFLREMLEWLGAITYDQFEAAWGTAQHGGSELTARCNAIFAGVGQYHEEAEYCAMWQRAKRPAGPNTVPGSMRAEDALWLREETLLGGYLAALECLAQQVSQDIADAILDLRSQPVWDFERSLPRLMLEHDEARAAFAGWRQDDPLALEHPESIERLEVAYQRIQALRVHFQSWCNPGSYRYNDNVQAEMDGFDLRHRVVETLCRSAWEYERQWFRSRDRVDVFRALIASLQRCDTISQLAPVLLDAHADMVAYDHAQYKKFYLFFSRNRRGSRMSRMLATCVGHMLKQVPCVNASERQKVEAVVLKCAADFLQQSWDAIQADDPDMPGCGPLSSLSVGALQEGLGRWHTHVERAMEGARSAAQCNPLRVLRDDIVIFQRAFASYRGQEQHLHGYA